MSWNYAELSQKAKAVGGPEKLVETLIESGKQTGRGEMIPWFFVTAVSASVATWGITKMVSIVRKKKVISVEEAKEARETLIKGIKNYDEINNSIERNETLENE